MPHTSYLLGCTCPQCLVRYIQQHANSCTYGKIKR